MRINIHPGQWYIIPTKTLSVFYNEDYYTFLCFTLAIKNKSTHKWKEFKKD